MAQTKSLRQKQEEREHQILGPFASYADESGGRDHEEPQCDIRTDFQRDRDRILHCKAFRRLKQKTQVFLAPEGDHYRTRLTHTLEVAQNARTIARALLLNEDLTEAIALGHDLGHTPFGHAGERALNRISEEYGGFHHNEQSVRVVERLEKDGKGLNLTAEVRDGILNHQTSLMPMTLEGKIVRLSDKIAYLILPLAVMYDVMHQRIQATVGRIPQNICQFFWNLLLPNDTGSDRIIYIRIDIRNLVR